MIPPTTTSSCPPRCLVSNSIQKPRRPNNSRPFWPSASSRSNFVLWLLCFYALLSCPTPSYAIKFDLQSSLYPVPTCIWNTAHKNALIVITANVGPGKGQRVDVEIRDREGGGNVYLSKKDIKAETRLAVTAHADGDVGVCFTNTLDHSELRLGLLNNVAPMLI